MDLPRRKENRLSEYDYSRPGCYFVTVCTANREPILWAAEPVLTNHVGADIIRPQDRLSEYGKIVDESIRKIPAVYPLVQVDNYVIMADHIHLLLRITENGGRMISAPTKPLSTVIGQMKRAVTKRCGRPVWQKGYHDHVVRNDEDYRAAWAYIDNNPLQEREDRRWTTEEE